MRSKASVFGQSVLDFVGSSPAHGDGFVVVVVVVVIVVCGQVEFSPTN